MSSDGDQLKCGKIDKRFESRETSCIIKLCDPSMRPIRIGDGIRDFIGELVTETFQS
jgi:hypothetical protein